MKTAKHNPADVLIKQHATITRAIHMLQQELDSIPCPDESTEVTWADVARASCADDCAESVIEWLEES
jgi:hypothetical protein